MAKQFEVNGRSFSMIDNMNELNLRQYIRFVQWTQEIGDNPIDVTNAGSLMEILCNVEPGELDDIEIGMMGTLSPMVSEAINKSITPYEGKHFKIGDGDYLIKESIEKITQGEYTSIQTMIIANENRPDLYIPYIVAVLIRPAKEVMNIETGKVKWVMEKFKHEDVEDRIEIFKDKLTADKIMACTNFIGGQTQK